MHEPSVALIGPGNVGKALQAQIAEADWNLKYVVRQSGVFNAQGELIKSDAKLDGLPPVDLTFISTPSKPIERNFIDYYTHYGIPVVSSAKWTLSCEFGDVRERKHLIGHYAMVGGGTTMVPWISDRTRGRRDVTMHGVLNGTMCFILDQIDREKRSLGQAVKRAQDLKYVEPGATLPLEVIRQEVKDTGFKAGVISNLSFDLPEPMCAEKIGPFRPFGQDQLDHVVAEAHERRYIVSFLPESAHDEPDIIGGFEHTLSNGMRISAGFKNIRRNPLLTNLVLQDANNAVITIEGPNGRDGIYMGPSGPGAGPDETANAMMINARKLMWDLYKRRC